MELKIDRTEIDGVDSFVFTASLTITEGGESIELCARHPMSVSRFLGEQLLSMSSVEASGVLFGQLIRELRLQVTGTLRGAIYEQIGQIVRPAPPGAQDGGSGGVPGTITPGG